MNKHIIDEFSNSEILKRILKNTEPFLSSQEKQEMWEGIQYCTLRRARLVNIWKWTAAASVVFVALVSWLVLQTPSYSNSFDKMANLVDADTLRNITLFVDNQKIELKEQVKIRCLGNQNQVEIQSLDGESFIITASNRKSAYMHIGVPQGMKAEVMLADNSIITVRERTKLSFPLLFSSDTRKVYLEGEAYMQITRNKKKRFIAESKNMNVAVLGTEFLLSAYPKSTEQSVLLISGKVEVSPVEGKGRILSPNERYVLDLHSKKAVVNQNVDADLYLCWKENLIEMNNESLSSVLQKIESIYQINFNYNWDKMSAIHINGKLDVSVPLEELLDCLVKIAPIKIDKKNKRITYSNNP